MRPVILAAGLGTRFGRPKAEVDCLGKMLLEHVLERLEPLDLLPAVVVLRPDAAQAQEVARRYGAMPVLLASRSQSESLRAGILAAGEVDAYLLLLVDQPFFQAEMIRRLERTWQQGALAVFSEGGHGPQPPALLDRSLAPRLLSMSGEEGARRVAWSRMPGVVWLHFPHGLWQEDIDTPADLERIARRLRAARRAASAAGEPSAPARKKDG